LEHCDTYWYECVSGVKLREDGDRDYDPYIYGEGKANLNQRLYQPVS
jgi:hypothetical protein